MKTLKLILIGLLGLFYLNVTIDAQSYEVPTGPFLDSTSYIPPIPLNSSLYKIKNKFDFTNNTITITHYKQCGQSWSNYYLGTCTNTVCKSGCAMTDATMLLKANGVNVDPGQLNTWLTSNSGYANGCDLYWAVVTNYPGATLKWNASVAFNLSTLKSEIDGGNPVIVNVDHPYGSTGTCNHWVLVYGYNNSGTSSSDFLVSDPGTTTCPSGCNLSYYTICSTSYPLRTYHNVSNGISPTPPSNDNCSNAITLTPSSTCSNTSGDIAGATQSYTASGCASGLIQDVWYKFTATSTGTYTIKLTPSSSMDGIVEVRQGSCTGTVLGCADSGGGNGGIENLNVTVTNGTVYYIRVYDYNSTGNTTPPLTTSFNICLISSTPTITVTSPNGGENWQAGSTQSITWTSTGVTGTVQIQPYLNGVAQTNIAAAASNTGSYSWTIPSNYTSASTYKIGISAMSGTVSDLSNSNFTISSPTITVTSPNGGENWQAGSTQSITWSSSGVTGTIQIQPYQGSTPLTNIAPSAPNTGSYSWTIPSNYTPASTYRIGISAMSGTVSDLSNSYFTISSPSPVTCSITSIQPSTVTHGPASFSTTSGSDDIIINGQANCNFNVTENCSWLSVTPMSGTTNSVNQAFLNYSIDANTTTITRQCTFYVNGSPITITQNACSFEFYPTTKSVSASGSTYNLDIYTDSPCSWSIQNSSSWVHPSQLSGTGYPTISVTVDPNMTCDTRTCTLTISPGNQTHVITQPSSLVAPTSPTSVSASKMSIINGESTTLQVLGGALNSAPEWVWYKGSCGGTQIGTGTTLSVSPSSTTTYYVQASACGISTTCKSITINNTTAVDEISASDKIKISPNPTTGKFDITGIETLGGKYKIEIFNNVGVSIQVSEYETIDKKISLDLSGYPTGMYLIKISNNGISYQKKVVKK